MILGILVLLERLSLCEEIQVILAFEGHQVILGHEDNREPEALQGTQEEKAQRVWSEMFLSSVCIYAQPLRLSLVPRGDGPLEMQPEWRLGIPQLYLVTYRYDGIGVEGESRDRFTCAASNSLLEDTPANLRQ